MSDCDCCGCVRRDNYRAHRVVARKVTPIVYEETFAARTSTTRDFFELYDRIGVGSSQWLYYYYPHRTGDTRGPYSLECSREWEVVDATQANGEWTNPGRAMDGESTLVGLVGNEFTMEPSFVKSTPETGEPAATLAAAGYESSLSVSFYVAMPDGPASLRFPIYPSSIDPVQPGTLPAALEEKLGNGRSGGDTLLEFGGQEIAVQQVGGYTFGLLLSYESRHLGQNDDGGYVTAFCKQGYTVLPSDYGGEINRPRKQVEDNPDDPNIWPDPTPTAPTPNPKSQFGYFSAPVKFGGRKLSVYRDGQLAAELTNPTEAEALAASAENGSYLLVNEPDPAADPPWENEGRDDRRRYARPFKSFESFAKDDTPPIVGCSPPQDFYHGFPIPFAKIEHGFGWVNATKPVVLLGGDPDDLDLYCWSDHETDRAPRAYLTSNGFVLESDHTRSLATLDPGTYTVRKFELVEPPYCLFGNETTDIPTFTVTVHPAPEFGVSAPYPRFEPPGFKTREYLRARLPEEKVGTVDLFFIEGRVFADGVTADQLTLTKDGEPVEGCTIAQVADQRWRVTVPTEPQTPGAFFVLTFDPAGEVTADRNRVETWPSFDRFPPDADSEWRVAYVDGETGKWYTKKHDGGYQEIPPNTPPLRSGGEPWENEPVVCATRVSWLMAAEKTWPRFKPVNFTQAASVGDIASIGQSVGSFETQTGRVRFACENKTVIGNWGATRSAGLVDGYSPNCPADQPETDDCSFFGLTTTIDPCPPKTLSCPAPNAPQRHSSALRTSGEILSFKISMVQKEPLDFRPPVWAEYTVSNTLYGRTLYQNLYAAEIESGPVPTNPAPIPFLNPPAPTYTVESGVIFVFPTRRLLEVAALQTAIPEELRITIRQELLVRQTSLLGAVTYWATAIFDVLTLSKNDEDALLAGEPVEIPYGNIVSNEAPFRRAFWWRLQKA